MTTITIDASRTGAKAVLGVRGQNFVVTFPEYDAELVFTDSGGSLWRAIVLALGVGAAIAERAAAQGDELVTVAIATEREGVH